MAWLTYNVRQKMFTRGLVFLFLLVFVGFGAAGCLPFSVPQSPRAAGTVVDADTQAPIPDAHISFKDFPESTAVSNAAGYFEIKSKYKTHWLPALPFDFFPPYGIMVIEALDYQTLVFNQRSDVWPTWVEGSKGGHIWKLKKRPNQALLPTPMLVAPAADAPVSPIVTTTRENGMDGL